ncbi:hypothetical protein SAMD00079811_60330 [Scytonema sp. HK-05]|nr:hypothetical protein SAMD00079811_60330 [Scytonema sp. HK-05]
MLLLLEDFTVNFFLAFLPDCTLKGSHNHSVNLGKDVEEKIISRVNKIMKLRF